MKTDKELRQYAESLLKSYKTRRDNLMRKHRAENDDRECWILHQEIVRYDLKIQTIELILK